MFTKNAFRRMVKQCIAEVLTETAPAAAPEQMNVEIMLDGKVFTFVVIPPDGNTSWEIVQITPSFPDHAKMNTLLAFIKFKGQVGTPPDRKFNERSYQFLASELGLQGNVTESVEFPIPCPKCKASQTIIDNPSTPIIYRCSKCQHRWNPDYQKPKKLPDHSAELRASNKMMQKMGLDGIDEAASGENKLSNAERKQISKAFAAAGLDGNGHFEKKEHGLQAITKVLDSLGFQLDMVSGDMIMGDQGSRNLIFRRKNDAGQDAFTEKEEIGNSRIVFTWYNRAPQGSMGRADYEILSYAS